MVLDDISGIGIMLNLQQVELIRFELASLIADQELDDFAPTFEHSRCCGTSMHIHCIDAESVEWLLSKREAIGAVIDGAELRMRKRSDMLPSVKMFAFFPIPKVVVPAFVLHVLVRQNRHLDFSEWGILGFEAVEGKDPTYPLTGKGYFIIFDVDANSYALLKDSNNKVHFGVGTVTLRNMGGGRPAELQEVNILYKLVINRPP